MSDIIANIKGRARQNRQLIALSETEDDRTYRAARQVTDEAIARIALIGQASTVEAKARELGVSLDGIEVIDPTDEAVRRRCADLYAQMRAKRGVTLEKAREKVLDPMCCAVCLLKLGDVNGSVAGAAHTTADTVRPLLRVVKTAPGVETVSSCFIMTTPRTDLGVNGAFIFADAGLVPQPWPHQLADIAIASAESARLYLEAEPYVAMLSFSTYGSADHPDVAKVREATRIARRKRPDLNIDGELQGDAALIAEVAERKCPGSKVAGRANVLIFPDLDAGNIAYKLVQRLTNGGAYGPLLQGLAKPAMDLSRGASVDDIVNVVAVAALRAGAGV
jgi:phosphate acetyltransferase